MAADFKVKEVQGLIQSGVSVNRENRKERSAWSVFKKMIYNNYEWLIIIWKYIIIIIIRFLNFRSILHEMVLSYVQMHPFDQEYERENFVKILTILVQEGLDVNLADVYRKTALHYLVDTQRSLKRLITALAASGSENFRKAYIILIDLKSTNSSPIT